MQSKTPSGSFWKILRSSLMLAVVILLLVAPTIYSLSIPSQVSVSNFTGLACNNTYCVYPTTISGTQNYFALNASSSCLYGYCGSSTPNAGNATGTSANSVISKVFNQLVAGNSVFFSFGNYSVVGDLNLTKTGVALTFQPGTIFTFSGLTTGGLIYDPTPHGSASGPLYIYGFPTFAGSNSGKTAFILRDGYTAATYKNSTGRSEIALNIRGTWTTGASIEGVTYSAILQFDVKITGPASGTGTGIQLQNSPASAGANAPNNNLIDKPELDITPGSRGNAIGINLIQGNNEVIQNLDGAYENANVTALKVATVGNRIVAPRFESNAHDINFTTGADKNTVTFPIFVDPSGNPTIVDTSTGVNNWQTDGISNNYGNYFSNVNVWSYYPMDESSGTSVFDLSGNVAPGVLTNSPSWIGSSHCVFSNCLSFANASSQYVALTSPTASLPVTETLWFNATSFPVNGNKPEEIAQVAGGDLSLTTNATATYAKFGGIGIGTSFAPITLITAHWYFLVVIATATYQQLCINASDTSLSCSSQLAGSGGGAATWSLAKASSGSFYYYNGKLDNVEIFRTAQTIVQLYQDFQQTPLPFEQAYSSEGLACSNGQVILSNTVGSTCGVPAQDIRTDLAFNVQFQNNTHEIMQNINGTAHGSCCTFAAGVIGESASFTRASSQYLDYGNFAPANFGSNGFTISAWFKSGCTGVQSCTVMAKGYVSSETGWLLRIETHGELGCGVQSPSHSLEVQTNVQGAYNNSKWQFATCTFNSASKLLTLYVNGSSVASGTATSVVSLTNTNLFQIGVDDASNFMSGNIQDVRGYQFPFSSNQVSEEWNYQFNLMKGN